ncbi:MAG TPA: NUDIX domain-containing protein [Allosphingosinicella sp.]|nr:NUDIX domain-containing protein [Allosphingosinicella sp.]
MEDDLPDAIPAATLILMRPAASGGPPEILMLERAETMAFAAGALVFPGGRIDPEDHQLAARFPGIGDAAARIAAIRETIEETGVAPALCPAPDAAALRQAMSAGRPFAQVIEEMGLTLDLDALTPFARWCPNFREARRFDTLFYLAEAPPGGGRLHSADETESVHTFWASAAEVLAEIEAGRAKAIFPTRRNLERLAGFGSLAEARTDAARHEVRRITPWVEERQGRRFVCIPEGIGYPVTAEAYESARRR